MNPNPSIRQDALTVFYALHRAGFPAEWGIVLTIAAKTL